MRDRVRITHRDFRNRTPLKQKLSFATRTSQTSGTLRPQKRSPLRSPSEMTKAEVAKQPRKVEVPGPMKQFLYFETLSVGESQPRVALFPDRGWKGSKETTISKESKHLTFASRTPRTSGNPLSKPGPMFRCCIRNKEQYLKDRWPSCHHNLASATPQS